MPVSFAYGVRRGRGAEVEKLLGENMESAYRLAVELRADLNEGGNWYDLK